MTSRYVVTQLRDFFDETTLEVAGWMGGEFLGGVVIVVQTCLSGVIAGRQQVVSKASRKLSCFLIVTSVLTFILVGILWTVLVILVWMVSALVTLLGYAWLAEWLWFGYSWMTFWHVFNCLGFIVPQCNVLFLHYWAREDQDCVFIAALRDEATRAEAPTRLANQLRELSDALEVLPVEGTLQWLRRSGVASCKGICLALCAFTVAGLPGIGPLSLQVMMMIRRRRAIGLVPMMLLLAVPVLPSLSPLAASDCRMLAAYGLQFALAARSVSRELLYPLLGRCGSGPRHALSGRHHARIIGFGAASVAVLSVPVVGPLLWFDLVWSAAKVLSAVVLREDRETFDLGPRVQRFRDEEARLAAEAAALALQRQANAQTRQEEKDARARKRAAAQRQREVSEA